MAKGAYGNVTGSIGARQATNLQGRYSRRLPHRDQVAGAHCLPAAPSRGGHVAETPNSRTEVTPDQLPAGPRRRRTGVAVEVSRKQRAHLPPLLHPVTSHRYLQPSQSSIPIGMDWPPSVIVSASSGRAVHTAPHVTNSLSEPYGTAPAPDSDGRAARPPLLVELGESRNAWPTATRPRPSEIDAPSFRDTTPVVRVPLSPGFGLSATSEPIVTIRPGPSSAATDTCAITGGNRSDRPEVKGLSTLVIGSSQQPQS